MSGNDAPVNQGSGDRRALRREQTIAEIVDAAWELSRANGLGNFSMLIAMIVASVVIRLTS